MAVAKKASKSATKKSRLKLYKDREEEYFEFLNRCVDVVFEAAAAKGWTWPDFATHAGVSASTVYRLGYRETRFPAIRTVFLLARAVDLEKSMELETPKTLKKKAG